MKILWRAFLFIFGCILANLSGANEDARTRELTIGAEQSIATAEQRVDRPSSTSHEAAMDADKLTHAFRMEREKNKLLEAGFVSGLAIFLLLIVLGFLSRLGAEAAQHMVNATGLICIVFGTILLVLMAETDQQLTASVGILGAVAGYLFRSMRPDVDRARTAQRPPAGNPPPAS